MPRGRSDDTAVYRAFSLAADEVIEADQLCDADELSRLRICSISNWRICRASSRGSPTDCSAS
jgi:cobalamin biosynthesis protein CobT